MSVASDTNVVRAIKEKIVSLEELERIVARLKSEGKTIAHCHGVFDLFTPAHSHQLLQVIGKADVVIVTVTEDIHVNKGPGRPFFNENLRARQIACHTGVDYVTISRWPSAVECIRLVRAEYYVKGESNKNYDPRTQVGLAREIEVVNEVGGEVLFTEELPYHSSGILNRFLPVFPPEIRTWLDAFRKRYSAEDVIARLKVLKQVKCLLVGEVIIDEYCYVKALGKPTKGSHIAADVINSQVQAGGILAAANHLASFCDEVTVVACIGSDGKEELIEDLMKPNVKVNYFKRNGASILKRRFVERHSLTKLFQTYEGAVDPLSLLEEERLILLLQEYFSRDYDLCLVIDYGHGFINSDNAHFISSYAPWLALSVQTNTANFGYNLVTRYPRADYVCVDEPELRLALRDQWGDIRELAQKLNSRAMGDFRNVICTQGHNGCIVLEQGQVIHIPAFSQKVVDTVGAGDAFITLTSPCIKIGMPLEMAGLIGNAAGALAVGTIGNTKPIEAITLHNFINTLLK